MHREINVMQVLRVPPMGKLVVEVNEQRYQNLSEVTEQKINRFLLAAIGELVDFAGGYQILVDAGMAPAMAPSSGGVASPSAPPKPTQTQQQAEFLAKMEAERDALKATPTTARRPSLLGGIRQPLPQPEPVQSPESELSVVEQIDAILQGYLANDPELGQRSIHLDQDPAGGLRIQVDGRYYQRPAEIKETKIQIYIKRALKKWEST